MPRDPFNDAARIAPYVGDILMAAHEFGLQPAILAGICLRESLAGWALTPPGTHLGWGDRGHGWGLFQADDRSWKSWILSADALTPLGQARQAARELAANWKILALTLPGQPAALIERAAVAAYNAPVGAVAAQLIAGRDPDAVTTPGPSGRGDYSADVYARAERLSRAGSFPPLDVAPAPPRYA